MSRPFWCPTDEQRRTILLIEALGLIHDLGKLSDMFFRSRDPNGGISYRYNVIAEPRQLTLYNTANLNSDKVSGYVEYCLNSANSGHTCAFHERSNLTQLLQRVKITDWTDEEYTFAELVNFSLKPSLADEPHWHSVLGKSMFPARLISFCHGIAHIDKDETGGTHENKMRHSDLFRATPFGVEKKIIACSITQALRDLPLESITVVLSGGRSTWIKEMRQGLEVGLADNRRPLNDVTLWDWGYLVASMSKAIASYLIRNSTSSNDAALMCRVKAAPFRTLSITIDRLDKYCRCSKISDMLGIKLVLDDAYKKIREYLEEEYPVGNRIYHDETGEYYLIAECHGQSLLDHVREKVAEVFPEDFRPLVDLGTGVIAQDLETRTYVRGVLVESLKKIIAGPRQRFLSDQSIHSTSGLYLFEKEWNCNAIKPEKKRSRRLVENEICTVCGLRPVGYSEGKSHENILQKARARHVCTICLNRRGKRAEKWCTELDKTIWIDEVADGNGRYALFIGSFGLEGWLDGEVLETTRNSEEIEKLPSPARIYRIVETTRQFWKDVSVTVVPGILNRRSCRIAFHPEEKSVDLGDYHTFELSFQHLTISVVWDSRKKKFVSTENLDRLDEAERESLEKLLCDSTGVVAELYNPSEYGKKSTLKLSNILISKVERLDGYIPLIPLLSEPGMCMMLIPADKAGSVAEVVKKQYEEKMGRVRDRLPLDLGLVFAKKRTPVRALLEAGRKMLEMKGDTEEEWTVVKNQSSQDGDNPEQDEHADGPSTKFRTFSFDNGVTWKFPLFIGDGEERDEWYTWVYRSCGEKKIIAVENVIEGDKICVRPSHFDFEYLDTSGRRYEIHYDHRSRISRRTRPYYLEDIDRFSKLWNNLKKMTVTQRQQVIRTIEDTRELWLVDNNPEDEVFRRFIYDTLSNAEWSENNSGRPGKEVLKSITDAGAKGELADIMELYMQINKQ